MPSPFPGMDSYLEHPSHFPSLHGKMIIYLEEALQPRLPEPYFAKTGERVWVEFSERYVEPDVNLWRGEASAGAESAGGVALATRPRTEPVVVTVTLVPNDEHREAFLEIYARDSAGKRLVTVIEVLSPANKTPGEQGFDLYVRKQREVLSSPVHLVEIDLLRSGKHVTAVSQPIAVAQAGPFDYHVCIRRFDERGKYYVYPIQLTGRLPEIAVPLLPGDASVPIDLQAVFDRCYDTGPYRREIDYRADNPQPPLRAEQVTWARGVLETAQCGSGTGRSS